MLAARFPGRFLTTDYDRRLDAMLADRKLADASRLLGSTSPARRAAFQARIAMLQKAPDAEALFAPVAAQVSTDAGLLMDRTQFLRDTNNEPAARQLAARPHAFTARPANVERFYELMLILARGASADRQYQTAFDIARQLDDSLPPGALPSAQRYGVRDEYTSLAWLAGQAALQINKPASAMTMFDKYANGGKSLQVASKGYYWAGRAALQSRLLADSTRYFEKAAQSPDQFYGQLALERLGRTVPAPGGMPSLLVTDTQRIAFQNKRLVAAVRQLGMQGQRSDQTLFIRALSDALDTDGDRVLAIQLASTIGRPDLAVWTARSARNNGSSFYYRAAYPVHSFAASSGRLWSLAHGITRQESSFDRAVVSHANAHGMMQIVPATGREQAGKMGIAFDSGRLTSDPAFNVMIGTAYFQRLLDNYGGSFPLAVAAYNAGPGNVRKWLNAYGDPRTPGRDVLSWIEQIPFEETRGYVQRVLENSVVYDTINPTMPATSGSVHLSSYLGKTSRPG
jgi:soluble lytic murein transglycosylase